MEALLAPFLSKNVCDPKLASQTVGSGRMKSKGLLSAKSGHGPDGCPDDGPVRDRTLA